MIRHILIKANYEFCGQEPFNNSTLFSFSIFAGLFVSHFSILSSINPPHLPPSMVQLLHSVNATSLNIKCVYKNINYNLHANLINFSFLLDKVGEDQNVPNFDFSSLPVLLTIGLPDRKFQPSPYFTKQKSIISVLVAVDEFPSLPVW